MSTPSAASVQPPGDDGDATTRLLRLTVDVVLVEGLTEEDARYLKVSNIALAQGTRAVGCFIIQSIAVPADVSVTPNPTRGTA